MRSVEGVLDAAVVQRGSRDRPWLAGFILVRNRAEDLADLVRKRLTAALPEYMVPRTIDELDSFPLNPNGKVKRDG